MEDNELPLAECIATHIFGSGVSFDNPSKADVSACDVLADYDVSASACLAASLRDGTSLVLEGPIVSVLADLPLAENVPPILWALDEPETVYAAHRLYGATGIDVAVAPLAGCLPEEIEQLGLNVSMKTLVSAQIRAASLCGCPHVMVEIDGVGKPTGTKLQRTSFLSRDARAPLQDLSSYRALALAALHGGAHGFILGCMPSLHALDAIYQTIRSVSDAPVIGFCLLEEHTLETPFGDSMEDIMATYAEMAKTDAVAIGFDEISSHDLCQIAEDIARYARACEVRPAVRIASLVCSDMRVSETVDATTTSVAHAAEVCARSGITIIGAASGMLPATAADLVAAFHA